jgi:hypothetical protein
MLKRNHYNNRTTKCNNINFALHLKQSTTQDTTLITTEMTYVYSPTCYEVKIGEVKGRPITGHQGPRGGVEV